MRLALVVGHTRRSPGAWSPTLQLSEYQWNGELAAFIAQFSPHEVRVFWRDGHGIEGAYAAVAAWAATAAIELHFNSAVAVSARGSETLYRGALGLPLAQALQRRVVAALGLPDRGAKLPFQGRGEASLTALPSVPTVILEPFFGSNAEDCLRAEQRKQALASAILEGARDFHGGKP